MKVVGGIRRTGQSIKRTDFQNLVTTYIDRTFFLNNGDENSDHLKRSIGILFQ